MAANNLVEGQLQNQSSSQSGIDSLAQKIKTDPELWAEIHMAAIRTIEELRIRCNVPN